MTSNRVRLRMRLRQLHKSLVPFMVLPLLLTLTTGTLFQFAVVSDRANDFFWLLDLHRGKFGQVNLEFVYPILNALGLLTLIITGSIMWVQSPDRKRRNN
ncbi:MAG: PepSY domain-containing protein [Phormidesmis sp.]